MRTILFTFASASALLFGQLDSNSVTVSATRNNNNLQPDQAVFAVFVDSPLTTSFNDVLAAVAPAGLSAANFSGVGNGQILNITPPGPQAPAPTLEWAFALPVPLSKTKDTVTALTALQQNLDQQKNGLKLTFQAQGSQVSPQLQQSQTCSIPDLLSDARAQAQKLADAAGLTLGPILALSSPTTMSIGTPVIAVSRFGLSSGSFSIPSICSLAVKFGLTRY